MKWPWQKETRESSSYTDAVIAHLTAAAGGTTAKASATAAIEAASGFVARAFASAEVNAPAPIAAALDPFCLAMIGRSLIRRGEIVFRIEADPMRGLRLAPAQSWDVIGSDDPSAWRYRLVISGPDRTKTYNQVNQDSVIHLRFAADPQTPWRGMGPLQSATLAGKLSAETAAELADEAGGPRGSFLPIPVAGDSETADPLIEKVKAARGRMLAVQAGDWSSDPTARAQWDAMRFGADPPAPLVELHKRGFDEVIAACGLDPTLFDADAAGPAKRESYRQALFATIAPLGRLVAGELTRKLEREVSFAWSEMAAADIVSRARGFQSMVQSGMDIERAASLSGLMTTE